MKITRWEGCYDFSWKGFITPASFSHPAKYARGLIERIFDHCLARGYLKRGGFVTVTPEIQRIIIDELHAVNRIPPLCNSLERSNLESGEGKGLSSNLGSPQSQKFPSEQLRSESSASTELARGLKLPNQTNGCSGPCGIGLTTPGQSPKDFLSTISTKTNSMIGSKTSLLLFDQDTQLAIESNSKRPAHAKSSHSKKSSAQNAEDHSKERSSIKTACATPAENSLDPKQSVVTSSGYVVTEVPEVGSVVYRRPDICADCFGGIGSGGIVAAYRGLEWQGVELEPKFVALAEDNFALHHSKLDAMGLPWPRIIQGDSRAFHVLIGGTDAMVSSPPFATQQTGGGSAKPDATYGPDGHKFGANHGYQNQGAHAGNIAALKDGSISGVIASPPYAVISTGAGGLNTKPAKHPGQQSGRSAKAASQDTDQKYGQQAGQIAVLKEGSVAGVISSPPYADTTRGNDACGIDWDKAAPTKKTSGRHQAPGKSASTEYGITAGQIGALKSGSVDGVVSSPPYISGGHHPDQTGAWNTNGRGTNAGGTGMGSKEAANYGKTEGQIGQLQPGDVHAVVTSPPWEKNTEGVMKSSKFKDPAVFAEQARKTGHGASLKAKLKAMEADESRDSYGDSPGQIGKEGGETYWQAMGAVYRSCFKAIKPGGVLVLVVKDYVKGGKRVPLCDDTVRLIEHVGFVMVERIHAMLVKSTNHADLFGADTVQTKSRKSFFRRLAEKKGSPAIDFEEVLIARRL